MITYGLPSLFAVCMMFLGFYRHKVYLLVALWVSAILLIWHHRIAGGSVLGPHFDYNHAVWYSLDLIVLVVSILGLVIKETMPVSVRKIMVAFLVIVCIADGLLFINVWVNAYFMENRKPNTPLLEVAMVKPTSYCHHHKIFYKVGVDGQWYYMCPDYYGLLPSIGKLDKPPELMHAK